MLDNIFEKFDDAVERHGMHKYQHVADWYIITCPRAARPFDESEQCKPYPSEYVASLARLANELRDITRTYKVEEHQLNLKIGIHCGDAAGAVIGIHRAFYCVYGDTTNTAARMCKYAEPNQILCTQEVVEQVKSVDKNSISFKSCGEKSIKGKGIMEVF
uniref:Guanylate cyclase domain-containing protein n=1 Tax=Guillardia theta (strain CCMP2712) TaxID=905079 RepID=A0A0C3U8M2_GUITC